jgi:hypothetical protein
LCAKKAGFLAVKPVDIYLTCLLEGFSSTPNGFVLLLHHHHHHISVMQFGHLLTRSDLTYPEVSSKVCHNSFYQLGNSVSLPWVIYCEAFYLHVGNSSIKAAQS